MNAVGRLSSLYLLKLKGAPKGASGRNDGLETGGWGAATVEAEFEHERTALLAELLLSGTASDSGDDETAISGSLKLKVSTFVDSATVPVFCLLAA